MPSVSPLAFLRQAEKSLPAACLVTGEETQLMEEVQARIRRAFQADDCHRVDLHKLPPEHATLGANKGLFGDAKELFQLFSAGKPAANALAFIDAMRARVEPPDCLMIVIAEWDYKYKKAVWFKKLADSLPAVICDRLAPADAEVWIRRWAGEQQVELSDALIRFLSEQTEGNLFAAKQAITKLALAGGGQPPDLPMLRAVLTDGARYDILDLSDAIYSARPARALAVLQRLRADGTADPLIQWSIGAVISNIAAAKRNERVLAWGQQLQAVHRMARAVSDPSLHRLVRQAAYADRVIKGVAAGDIGDIFRGLAAYLAAAGSDVKITLPYQPPSSLIL